MDSHDLRIVFAGTPEFAAKHLHALIAGGFNVVGAYSQPDRPTGRGKQLLPTPVKAMALKHGIAVFQPEALTNTEQVQILAELKPDILVVVAYGLLLPESILALPSLACINVHASLLPRWRGAAPIERSLMAGDAETGVCLMLMEKGLDSGHLLTCSTTPILPEDNSQTLGERLCELGCRVLCDGLQDLPALLRGAREQDPLQVTYAQKINKAEALIDWQQPAASIHNLVRAMFPRAPAFCFIQQKRVRLLATSVLAEVSTAEPGTVIRCNNDSIDVACQPGVLRIFHIQLEGKNAVSITSLLNGHPGYFSVGLQLSAN